MTKGISILICCYNSANRLPETIKHIAQQEIKIKTNWEVIVVNNNSTDNTQEVAQHEWNYYKLNIPFKVVDQPISGLSNARKKGIKEAQFEYIIFCDDDNWLDKDYIQTAYDLMESNPIIGVVGGQSTAASDVKIPDWFEKFKNGYAVGQQNNNSGYITNRGYVWGAGMVIRKQVILIALKLGFKSFLTGRNGNKILAGDDSEICRWAILLGYELFYEDKLKFKHYIPQNRLTTEYKDKMWEGFHQSNQLLYKYDVLNEVKKLKKNKLRNFLSGLKQVLLKSNTDAIYKQFLIGPYFRVSSEIDFEFIKIYYSTIYINKIQ